MLPHCLAIYFYFYLKKNKKNSPMIFLVGLLRLKYHYSNHLSENDYYFFN
jgi:hypothetical protein